MADAGSDAAPVEPVFEIGGALPDGTGFVDWTSGTAQPTIELGPQGGQHVWLSVRVRNVVLHKAHLYVTLAQPSDCAPYPQGQTEWRVPLTNQDGWLQYSGITAYVGKPCDVRGKPVHVKVQLNDESTPLAKADATIVPVWNGTCP